MASKTISLKEETYNRLARAKSENESFSDVVDRLLREEDHPLHGLIGLLDDSEVETLRERSQTFRESVNERMNIEDDQ
ncbi:antitoxin VapB family protein [Haladaptatus sp. CMAA 1911]|uniref:antitoxin VapB family protein n=1 Tax=unclassified Haladaptatus TaxID=2622732 RepID=UPI0037553D32